MAIDGPTRDPIAEKRRLHERIDNDFTYHPPPDANTREKCEEIRALARDYGHFLIEAVGPCRELSRALSDLEDCVMHANAGVARHTGGG